MNAAYAGYLAARRLLLLGRIEEAEARLGRIDGVRLPPAPRAACELIVAGIAIRRLDVAAAAAALQRAGAVARPAAVPSLIAEVERAQLELTAPAARRIARGAETPLRLGEVATLLASPALVVDACRNAVQRRGRLVPLGRRPVLFALARALAEAWPGEATRPALLLAAFHSRHDELHRTRLRVEIGLRAELRASPASPRPRMASGCDRPPAPRSSSWPGRSTSRTATCWHSSPTAPPGPAPPLPWRSAPASAASSGRWRRCMRTASWRASGAAARSAGGCRRCRISRRRCYSHSRWYLA